MGRWLEIRYRPRSGFSVLITLLSFSRPTAAFSSVDAAGPTSAFEFWFWELSES